jgi:hypothetical protein
VRRRKRYRGEKSYIELLTCLEMSARGQFRSDPKQSVLPEVITSPRVHDVGLILFVARAICLRDKPEAVLLVKLASALVALERPEAQVIKSALRNIQKRGADMAALPRWQYVELVDPGLAKRYEANEFLAVE